MNLKFEIFDMTDTSLMTEDMTRRSRRDKLDKSDKSKQDLTKLSCQIKIKNQKKNRMKDFQGLKESKLKKPEKLKTQDSRLDSRLNLKLKILKT